MRVFEGISPRGDDQTLVNAAESVASELHPIPPPRSLCEIQIDNEDYQWLCKWAVSLSDWRVQTWLNGVSSRRIALNVSGRNLTYAESFGCMFLLLASEAARREASEGRVWSAVHQQFPGSAGQVLFLQGQPRESLKDAMEVSARKLSLRHVYGLEGTQEYYIGVYLQFGFTRKGMARLAHRLAGQGMSESVQYLTGAGGDSLRSASFVELWDALKNFRRNNITQDQARALVAASPWTLSAWTDELLKQARERLELGTSGDAQTTETEQVSPKFLSLPRLRWHMPLAPEFVSHVENLADFELTSDRYLIKSDSTTLARLFRSNDGSYRCNPEEIVVSADRPELMATLVDDSGHSPASQLITLWEATEEVRLYDLSTGLASEDRMLASGREYGLLVSHDLEIEPRDLTFHHIGGNSYSKRMYRARGDANRPVSVNLGGETIWRSGATAVSRDKPVEPEWTRKVNAQLIPSNQIDFANLSPVSLTISELDDETFVTYIRAGAQPLDFEKLEGRGIYTSVQFDILTLLSPRTASPAFEVKIGLRRNGQQASITRSLVLSVKGVQRMTEAGWQVVSPLAILSSSEAKQYAYRILHPRLDGKNDHALMEGPVFLSRLWTTPRTIDSIGGYGAPLGVRSPYNWIHVRELLTIANEVHDHGLVETAIADQAGTLRMYLNQPLEPGELHRIVLWTPGISPVVLPAQESVTHPDGAFDIWDVRCPQSLMDEDGFTAIAYDGVRIGAWWPPHLRDALTVNQAAAQETATMLRWMHAPIVSGVWFDEVRRLAHNYPAHTLKAWLGENGLPNGLRNGVEGKQWMSAVRQIFSGWEPDSRSAMAVLRELGQESDILYLNQALQKLMQLDPLLMGRVARALIKASQMADVIRAMRCLIAGLSLKATYSDFGQREKELLDQVSYQMESDNNFIEAGIVRRVLERLDYYDLSPVDRNNAEVALNVAPFREYLGLKVLSLLVK